MANSNTKSKVPKPRKQMEIGSMGQIKNEPSKVAEPTWRTKLQRVMQRQLDDMNNQKPKVVKPKPKPKGK